MIILLKKGSSGSSVGEIQSVLKKLGLYKGATDGIYGPQTAKAVSGFQDMEGLAQTGEVDADTYAALEKYIMGYTYYTLKSGDTLSSIAQKNNSTVNLILSANPYLSLLGIRPGLNLTIPFDYEVVPTDISYTYDIMEKNIYALTIRYPFLKLSTAGRSVLGRHIYTLTLGTGNTPAAYNASHHSLEWITSVLMMKFIERACYAYINRNTLRGYNMEDWIVSVQLWINPMVNPDGIDLVINGPNPANPYYQSLMEQNTTGRPFGQVWQANIRGVDLNHNYDALWEESVKAAATAGITGPGPTRYPGPSPLSEPETKAMAALTEYLSPALTLAYHSQGQVIYWNFNNLATAKDKRIGEILAEVSGYTLEEAEGIASTGGYKDWFIQDFRQPGYTVEVGLGTNPLPITQFDKIYEDNEKLLLTAAKIASDKTIAE